MGAVRIVRRNSMKKYVKEWVRENQTSMRQAKKDFVGKFSLTTFYDLLVSNLK